MKIGLNSLSCLLKNNLIVILFALLVGILSVLPNFLAVEAIKPDYNGIPFLYTNNEDYYLARINELKDGHFLVSSPYFYEYKDSSPIIPPVGEYLYYFLSKISFLSLPNTIVLAKFLFPFFLFLLIYKLTLELLPGDTPYKKLISIGTALLVTLGYDLVDYRFVLARLKGAPFDALSVWTRPVNPITGALFIFSLFLLTLKIIKGESPRFAPVAAGVIFSLTIGYIFSFGIAFAVLSILFLTYLVKKNFSLAKKIALIIAVGFGLDLVYWLTILKTLSGGGMELALRNGMILSHLPIFNKFLFAGIILFFLIAIYLKTKKICLGE